MIVTTKDDVVQLAGSLVKNQWLTIKAAANLLLEDFPEGIVIDCSELERVSDEGAKTFLQAMQDIESAGARIVVASLPANVLEVLRTVPGVRSQLPTTRSVEEARASLRLAKQEKPVAEATPAKGKVALVPLVDEVDVPKSLALAQAACREAGVSVHAVCFLVVARQLALGTPLPEEEADAHRRIEAANSAAKALHLPIITYLERVREPKEGILQAIKSHHADTVAVSASDNSATVSSFVELASILMQRSPCRVLIERSTMPTENGGTHHLGE